MGKTCYIGYKTFFMLNSQENNNNLGHDFYRSELPLSIHWNSVEYDLGCTSRIYFDNVK